MTITAPHYLKYSARTLWRNPAFSLPAICALALAIAANTAIFSIIDAVLLRPLPFPHAGQLVNLWETNTKANIPRELVAPGNYQDWQIQAAASFAAISAWQQTTFNLTAGDIGASTNDEPERFLGALCDPALFTVLNTAPVLGRAFRESENEPGQDSVVILSHAVWLSRFGADPNILGRHLRFEGRTRTIIGVMPAGFEYPSKITMWAPLALDNALKTRRDLHQLRVIARLRDGVSLEQARSEMARIEARLATEYPGLNRDLGVAVNPMLEDTVRPVRPALLILMAAVVCVLLIACANVANLLLARMYARGRELAIRLSLGAGRRSLIQQMLTESLLLAGIAAALGLLGAQLALHGLQILAPPQLPRVADIHIDIRALLFTLAVALSTGILFGLAPAWHFLRTDLNGALKEASRTSSNARSPLRSALVVLQVAVALILLTGAGLLIRSFDRLMRVDPGFTPAGVITMRLLPAQSRYRGNNDLQIALVRGILREAKQLPGIQSAAVTTDIPLIDDSVYIMRFADRPNVLPSQAPLAHTAAVTPEFFNTMRIRLRQGRLFTDQDAGTSVPVAIISRQLAQRYFRGRDPIGELLEVVFRTPPEWRQIVGVVDDVRSEGLDQESPVQVYTPYLQRPAMVRAFAPPITVLARTAPGIADPNTVAQALKHAILTVDRSQPVYAVQPLSEIVSQSVGQRRLLLLLLSVFAGSALLLAALGLYAVLSYSVLQRRREIGIRIALGARSLQLLLLIEWHGMRLVLLGLLLGFGGALLLTRGLTSILFDTQPYDGLTWLCVAATLLLIGALACAIPALRATRVDAVHALAGE